MNGGDNRRRDQWDSRRDSRISKKQKLILSAEEKLESKLGFDLFNEGEKRLGWLLTFASVSLSIILSSLNPISILPHSQFFILSPTSIFFFKLNNKMENCPQLSKENDRLIKFCTNWCRSTIEMNWWGHTFNVLFIDSIDGHDYLYKKCVQNWVSSAKYTNKLYKLFI